MTYGSSTVKRRTSAELALVDDAIVAAVELNAPITLRGVYYRVVSAGAVEKTEDGYRLVGRQLLKLRRGGRVSYGDITDGTRWITKPQSWDRLDQMLEDAAASYRRSVWHDQRVEVQIYTEKDAITGVVLPVTERWDVPLGVARGYASESFAWSVAQSVMRYARRRRLRLPARRPRPQRRRRLARLHRESAPVRRRAVRRRRRVAAFRAPGRHRAADHQEWQLPTRPTKRTDTRSSRFSGESVEVDAIPPAVLRGIIEDAITQHIDPEALRLTHVAEQSERDILTRMIGGTP